MSCKLSDKCDNVFACNVLRPEVELLGCSFYKPKKPMTNEEWLKSLDTESLVDHLYEVHKGGASVERQAWIEKHKERIKMQIRGWLKAKHIEKE